MADDEAVRYWSNEQFICVPVREHDSAVALDRPVAVVAHGTVPRPYNPLGGRTAGHIPTEHLFEALHIGPSSPLRVPVSLVPQVVGDAVEGTLPRRVTPGNGAREVPPDRGTGRATGERVSMTESPSVVSVAKSRTFAFERAAAFNNGAGHIPKSSTNLSDTTLEGSKR